MNIGTESTNALETIDISRPFAETSSTPSPSLLQEQIPSNSVDPLSEIFPSRNRTPSCEFQDFVAPIVNTPEKIRYYGCTPEPEPGCSRIVSVFGPDIAAKRGDTVVPETEVNIRQNTSRDNSLDPKPGCSASHCSPLVLRPIPNPAKPMTTRERKLQKSEILTSTPIKEDQKQKYEKNKVKNVTKRLNDKSKNVPNKTNTKTDKDKKTAKKKQERNAYLKTKKEIKKPIVEEKKLQWDKECQEMNAYLEYRKTTAAWKFINKDRPEYANQYSKISIEGEEIAVEWAGIEKMIKTIKNEETLFSWNYY
ncbi:hypothetical protein FQA39_LY03050 [Lamprigera yunnana]|nr:hypothetical protein FQA39_LY03050 [Lamprigera yunnana]